MTCMPENHDRYIFYNHINRYRDRDRDDLGKNI